MKDYFLISEAAKAVHMTAETLRHYDRIGLAKPSHKDRSSNYRYYTKEDIVRLNTIRALQQMDLPLQKIKEVLEYDDLEKIVHFLTEAEKKADEKIAALQHSKARIQSAKAQYIHKLCGQPRTERTVIRNFPDRVIMLSDTLETPSLDTLWNYLSHFYDKIDASQKEQFAFEDLAGIYTENGTSRLFALCIRYADMPGLKILPKGDYLCADCTDKTRAAQLDQLMQTAREEYHVNPAFSVQQIVVSGILQWNYQIQIYIGNSDK